MAIDNFDIIREHLTFEPAMKFDSKTKELKPLNDTYDRYIVQVLNRAKDANGKSHGVNTSNRLIWSREISSLDYFDRKKPQIIELCERTGARAYIHPQVRSTYDCLKMMIKLGVENLENPTIKLQHIMRSCMSSMHKSRDKKWVVDLDSDCMRDYKFNTVSRELTWKDWTLDEVVELVRKHLKACKRDPNEAYVVKTKNGFHIVTSPFNLEAAAKECGMLFENEKKIVVEKVWTGPGEYELKFKKMNGWLHKDGMTLLYCPTSN